MWSIENYFTFALSCSGSLGLWRKWLSQALQGTGRTVISYPVTPQRDPSLALRLGWRLRLPQMWVTLVRTLFVWGSTSALIPENHSTTLHAATHHLCILYISPTVQLPVDRQYVPNSNRWFATVLFQRSFAFQLCIMCLCWPGRHISGAV